MRAASNWPQPSLNGTHTTIETTLWSCSRVRASSRSNSARPSALSRPRGRRRTVSSKWRGLALRTARLRYGAPPLTASCHTSIPRRSQWWYHRIDSILMCLRSIVKPSRFIVSTSCTSASSDGAVIRPSGQ